MVWHIFTFLCIVTKINCSSFGIIDEYFCTSQQYIIGNLCPGISTFCEIHFNSSNCKSMDFDAKDFTVVVKQDGREYVIDNLVLLSLSFSRLVLEIPFHPLVTTTVSVAIASNQTSCIFSTNETFAVADNCYYPLFLSQRQFPMDIVPGELFNFRVFVSTLNSIEDHQNVILGLFYHPGLSVVLNNIDNSDNTTTQNLPTVGTFDSQLDKVDSVVQFNVPFNVTVTLTFQVEVHSYVLPNSLLFLQTYLLYEELVGVSRISYIHYTMTSSTTEQLALHSLVINTNYLRNDILTTSLAPHRNENFTLLTSFFLPCVATSVLLNISLPDYEEDYGEFYFNITSITVMSSSNLLSLSRLFNYEEDFNATTTPLAGSLYPQKVVISDVNGGNLYAEIDFGGIQLESCSLDDNTTIYLQLHGLNLQNLSCHNYSLTDNVTIELSYISEVNQGNALPFDSIFATTTTTDTIIYPLNITRPVIDQPISTHITDALDNVTLTFGVEHDTSNSGMTAWSMNYTFIVSDELIVDDIIEYCYVNNDNTSCVNLPFVNFTVNNSFDM